MTMGSPSKIAILSSENLLTFISCYVMFESIFNSTILTSSMISVQHCDYILKTLLVLL